MRKRFVSQGDTGVTVGLVEKDQQHRVPIIQSELVSSIYPTLQTFKGVSQLFSISAGYREVMAIDPTPHRQA